MVSATIKTLVARLQSRDEKGRVERLALALEASNHSNCFVRRVAVECLRDLHPPLLDRALIRALSDRCWEVRVAAAEGVGALFVKKRRSPPQLIRLLNDPSKLVRVEVAQALGIIGDQKVLPRLRAALADRSSLVRRYVAEAIGRLGTRRDGSALRTRLKIERHESAKVGLFHSLYLLGDRHVLTELISLLQSRSYTVRSATALALRDTERNAADAMESERSLRRALKIEKTAARENMLASLAALRNIRRIDLRR